MTTYRESRYAAEPPPQHLDRAPKFTDGMPLFQWATRWETDLRDSEGEPIRKSGWVTAKGKSPELDTACRQVGYTSFLYTHPGSRNKAEYWHIKQAHFYILCTGVMTSWDMDKDLGTRTGIAYARVAHGAGDTLLRLVAVVEDLYDAGFGSLVRVTASRRMAFGALLPALFDHYRVIDTLDDLKGGGEGKGNTAFYEVSCALGPGAIREFGKEQVTKVVPIASLAPEQIDREYIKQHYIDTKARKGLMDSIEEGADDQGGLSLMDLVLEWSVQESKDIYEMTSDGNGTAGADPSARSFLTRNDQADGRSPRPDLVQE